MNARSNWEMTLRRSMRQLLERFGALGLIGIGLLLLALGLGLFTPQLTGQTEDLRGEVERTRVRLDEVRRNLAEQPGSAQRTTQLRASFPTVDHATADLRVMFDTAQKNHIQLSKGEYALAAGDDAGRLRRFEVTFPLKERYVTIKTFIADVLNAVPHASLSELRIERTASNVDRLDARVHFTLFYREQ